MKLDAQALLYFALCSTGIHWVVARSTVGKPIWSRATGWRDELLRCPACSGFWIGIGLWCLGLRPISGWFGAPFMAGLLGLALTPVVEGVMLWGLKRSAIEREVPPAATTASIPDLATGKKIIYDEADNIYNAVMDKLCAERADLAPDEIERIGGTIKRALGLGDN